jgi:hypothetical protein
MLAGLGQDRRGVLRIRLESYQEVRASWGRIRLYGRVMANSRAVMLEAPMIPAKAIYAINHSAERTVFSDEGRAPCR